MKILRFWIIVWVTLTHLDARTYVVSPQGKGANAGTFEIWSGLKILKPHSLPAQGWNR